MMAFYPSNNKRKINQTFSNALRTEIASVNSDLKSKLSKLNTAAAELPAKYNALKNQLTAGFRKTKKADEEYIANTGNHTASGYAMSKRMNTNSAYLNRLNDIDIAGSNALNEIENKKREAEDAANRQKRNAVKKNAISKLDYLLKESDRTDNLSLKGEELNLKWAQHKENMRVDDSTIAKNNASIKKTENDISIDNDKNERDKDIHAITLKYLPLEKDAALSKIEAETENIDSDTELNKAKTETEKENKKYVESKTNLTDVQTSKIKDQPQSTGGGSGSKRSGGTGLSKTGSLSKMSPADLAKNIAEQTGTKKVNSAGKVYYEPNPFKAYTLLATWKKKYNLSDQVVNDTAIHLGIQSYF